MDPTHASLYGCRPRPGCLFRRQSHPLGRAPRRDGSKESAIIIDLILELKQRGVVSMVMIAHNFAQILEVCDRVNLLQHGRITYDTRIDDTSISALTDLVSAECRGRRNRVNDDSD